MTSRQQWGLVVAIIVALAAGLAATMHFLGDELFPVAVGSRAPDFRASVIDGAGSSHGPVKTLADYKGQVVLLNVWATWCPPCKVEMPSMEALHRAYGPRGLKVVAVSIDDAAGPPQIRDFAKELGLTFEILHDSIHGIDRAYQTTGYPETFVIARDGTIRKKWIGPADWNSPDNRALIAELLGVPPESAAPIGSDAPAAAPLGGAAGDSSRAPRAGVGAR